MKVEPRGACMSKPDKHGRISAVSYRIEQVFTGPGTDHGNKVVREFDNIGLDEALKELHEFNGHGGGAVYQLVEARVCESASAGSSAVPSGKVAIRAQPEPAVFTVRWMMQPTQGSITKSSPASWQEERERCAAIVQRFLDTNNEAAEATADLHAHDSAECHRHSAHTCEMILAAIHAQPEPTKGQ